MGPFLFFCLVAQPFLEEASTQVQSLTYMDDIYLVGAPDKMPGVITSLQQNLGSANLKLNTNKSWATRECMRELKVNKEPKVMKGPVAIGEPVKVPLSPKVVNTVKAIEKVTGTQLALLLLLRQVNNNSFTYTLRTSQPLSTNKGHCYRVNKVHTLVICCGCVVVCD